jgi:hypothetical protein
MAEKLSLELDPVWPEGSAAPYSAHRATCLTRVAGKDEYMSNDFEELFDLATMNRWMWTMLFGEAIRGFRRKNGRSIRQAARRAGMDPNLWDAIEAGELAPTPSEVHQLARGLEMSDADLGPLVDCCQAMWTGRGLVPAGGRNLAGTTHNRISSLRGRR